MEVVFIGYGNMGKPMLIVLLVLGLLNQWIFLPL